MNFWKTLGIVDSKIIDKLTELTWWFEVNFGKDNVDIAIYLRRLANTFFLVCFAGICMYFYYTRQTVVLAVLLIQAVAVSVSLANSFFEDVYVLRKDIIAKYPQGNPNPTRYINRYRIRRFLYLLAFIYLLSEMGYAWSKTSLVFLAYVALVCGWKTTAIVSFLLSCDSLPPEEKARRRAKQQMKKHTPVMTFG